LRARASLFASRYTYSLPDEVNRWVKRLSANVSSMTIGKSLANPAPIEPERFLLSVRALDGRKVLDEQAVP
jgi:hypothetical protein